MTREQAIEVLNMVEAHGLADEAKRMAIEALQGDTVATIQTGQTYGKSAYIKELAEVVRCKDCEWRYVNGNTTNYYWCRENDCPVDDNDFCSWAKMKGGAE